VGKIIKECVAYDNKTRSEKIIGAPKFIHSLFTNKQFTKDHPDQLYVDVLFDLTLWIIIGGGLVSAGILPGLIYVAIKVIVFSGRFILLLHYTSHNNTSPLLTWYSSWIICPFFGLPFDTYRYHHLYMHHSENN
jgi:fatty acid desaturase